MPADVHGGPGSNQYQTKPGATPTARRSDTHAVKHAAEHLEPPEDPDRKLLVRLLDHLPIEPDEWETLTHHPRLDLRREAARHLDTPGWVLAVLATDEMATVAHPALRHPNCPPEVLAETIRNGSRHRVIPAVGNRNCPPEAAQAALSRASTYSSKDLASFAQAFARNGSLPEELHLKVIDAWGSHPHYVNASWTTPRMLERIAAAKHIKTETLAKIANHPNTPPDLLDRLAHGRPREPKVEAAGNPRTPPETLAYLATSKVAKIRYRVAANPATPAATLTTLWVKDTPIIRQTVERNPSCPPEITVAGVFGQS